MIIVVTIYERKEKTGRTELVASHGVCYETGNTVILPNEHPSKLGAKYDESLCEWVISS